MQDGVILHRLTVAGSCLIQGQTAARSYSERSSQFIMNREGEPK